MIKLHLMDNTLLPAINARAFCFCFLALFEFALILNLSLSKQVCTACLVVVVQCAHFKFLRMCTAFLGIVVIVLQCAPF